MALIIRASGKIEPADPPSGVAFTLEQMQAIVGGYVELVPLGGDWMMVNEEGRLKGLPVNKIVSEVAGQTIVGDVLLGTKRELGGDDR